MNNDIIEGNWKEIKGKVNQQWGRLTDEESLPFSVYFVPFRNGFDRFTGGHESPVAILDNKLLRRSHLILPVQTREDSSRCCLAA